MAEAVYGNPGHIHTILFHEFLIMTHLFPKHILHTTCKIYRRNLLSFCHILTNESVRVKGSVLKLIFLLLILGSDSCGKGSNGCKALRMIRDQESIDEQFSKALNLVGNGHFVFGTENKYLLALRDVLKEAVNDQYDYIDWWLYEATDDYTVWEADCTMKYCLKEPEALYDFITGTLKPVPVSSGESTSQQE